MNNEKEKIEFIIRDMEILKQTISSLNFLIESLKQSNIHLTKELNLVESEIEEKSKILNSFLQKHNLSIEDILEYETELKAASVNNKKKKKKS